jgi:hypothetical protein
VALMVRGPMTHSQPRWGAGVSAHVSMRVVTRRVPADVVRVSVKLDVAPSPPEQDREAQGLRLAKTRGGGALLPDARRMIRLLATSLWKWSR